MPSLTPGTIVRVRSRQYLVEEVTPPPAPADATLVRLSCLEDDALGEQAQVLWEHEPDAQVIDDRGWSAVASRGFDDPKRFSAYLHTMRWSCVTATDPKLFQSPYRAGIEVKAFQLEPLRKALLMPRVSLFVADDVGLGKTIEAGLILRELILRQKVRRVVVCCPTSVVPQWREEMEQRFGLTFMVHDRAYVTAQRLERGFGVNAWNTHSRFIISHALIRDEAYAAPLREWLGRDSSGTLLILDEAHNFAPSSGSRYAIDSKLTKTAREIAPLFEHKLFLSATPHNGHSNSFSALLEILDPVRFVRGVKVTAELRDQVMVRRLKKDLRGITDDFPEREVVRIVVRGLPDDAPDLVLARQLQQYRDLREERVASLSKTQKASAMLVLISLQKRLLSSPEAFARTLKVHRDSVERAAAQAVVPKSIDAQLLLEQPGQDDERADSSEKDVQAEEDAQVTAASQSGGAPSAAELQLLAEMTRVAERARHQRDGKLDELLAWVRTNLCPDLGTRGAAWTGRRVLIFTEYADTKRWLVEQLSEAIEQSDRAEERIATFHGGMGEESREAVKAAFNSDPKQHPLRILVATDAAREGVNFQNHCADLFHYDVPWNPGRMEQRNGRIDRKLQREKVVRCHYFVLAQRPEDRVLQKLVEKTATIHEELGSLPPVVERGLAKLFTEGIRHSDESRLQLAIDQVDEGSGAAKKVIDEELEEARERQDKLQAQVSRLDQLLSAAKKWLRLDDDHFREALSASLELAGAGTLVPVDAGAAVKDPARALWSISGLEKLHDASWAGTLDTLRTPIKAGEKLREWRRTAAVRPVVFRDPGTLDGSVVHLHLEHRVVQRLLGRFLAQGFLHDEISRSCVLRTDNPVPYVIALGRLSLYGSRATRLHDEVLAVAAEWHHPGERGKAKLKPLSEEDREEVLGLVEESLRKPHLRDVPEKVRRDLRPFAARDVEELVPHLERRARLAAQKAEKALQRRAEDEAESMRKLLVSLKGRIESRQEEVVEDRQLLLPGLAKDELRQLEADQREWARRLARLDVELKEEPDKVRATYTIKGEPRVQAAGLVYLWPVSR